MLQQEENPLGRTGGKINTEKILSRERDGFFRLTEHRSILHRLMIKQGPTETIMQR
jgi:hypothetical protein